MSNAVRTNNLKSMLQMSTTDHSTIPTSAEPIVSVKKQIRLPLRKKSVKVATPKLNHDPAVTLSSTKIVQQVHSEVAMDVETNVDENVENETSSTSSNEFNDLDISANTKKAITTQMKYKTMTPVQSASIPIILSGHDVVVKAKTGIDNIYFLYLLINSSP